MECLKLRHYSRILAIFFIVFYGSIAGFTGSFQFDIGSSLAQTGGAVPGNFSGNIGDAEIWRAIRKGIEGQSVLQDPKAGILVQSEGDNWRAFKNGPLLTFGGWILAVMLIVLAIFRYNRGQVKIDAGPSGQTVEPASVRLGLSRQSLRSATIVSKTPPKTRPPRRSCGGD